MVGLHNGLGAQALVAHGTEAARRRFLPDLADGTRIASFCATEPGAGSDLTAIRTAARRDGDGFRLDGEKCFVTNGGFAGMYTVLAKTPEAGGRHAQTLFCVPRELGGISIGPEEEKLGLRGSSTVTVTFDDVRLTHDHVLGVPGQAAAHANEALTWGRTLLSAGCIGVARAALACSLDHVTQRKQSGRTIGQFAATRAHVGTIARTLEAMESLVAHVGQLHERGHDLAQASAMAKVFCSEGAFDAADRAIQLHGGMGFLEGTGVPRLLRDCRVTRIFEGANDVLLVKIGTAMVASDAAITQGDPTLLLDFDDQAVPFRASERRLRQAVMTVRSTLGVRAVSQQLAVQGLARAHMHLLAAHACLERNRRADGTTLLVGRQTAEVELERCQAHLESLEAWEPATKRDRALSDALYAARSVNVDPAQALQPPIKEARP
jgi:alkylation response protein AidB-like acyl-CoA dehydrogenase